MASYSRLSVFTTMIETGFVPVFYHGNEDIAEKVILACVEGGATCFEFTNRGDQAHEVFSELIKRFKNDKRVILGAGTVLDTGTASLYIQLGANFIVGPVLNHEVARVCNRRHVAYIPGCATTSEISKAEELGAEICKIFPGAAVGGPAFVKDVLGPLPWARIMPTGGVEPSEESINKWFAAGVTCVGMGSKLFPAETIAAGDYAAITRNVANVVDWIKAARKSKNPIG